MEYNPRKHLDELDKAAVANGWEVETPSNAVRTYSKIEKHGEFVAKNYLSLFSTLSFDYILSTNYFLGGRIDHWEDSRGKEKNNLLSILKGQ